MSAVIKTVLALAAVGAVHAGATPTAPGPGDAFNVGQACPIKYTVDSTGTWKNMTIELMTGSNTGMVHVADVVTGIDGTTGDGSYSWTCPNVTPNSAIYFYQFTNNGAEATWTTRFTIAGADGSTTKPTESTQPGGQAIPWGTGRLASGAASGTGSGTGSGTATPSGTSGNSTSAVPSTSGRGRGNTTASGSSASSVPTGSYGSMNSSSGTASSSSSAAAPSGSSSTSDTSGAQKMVAGFVAAVAGVVGVASLVM